MMGIEPRTRASASSKRISRGLNARALLRKDDILLQECERPTILAKKKKGSIINVGVKPTDIANKS
jgi:hypothetical protein